MALVSGSALLLVGVLATSPPAAAQDPPPSTSLATTVASIVRLFDDLDTAWERFVSKEERRQLLDRMRDLDQAILDVRGDKQRFTESLLAEQATPWEVDQCLNKLDRSLWQLSERLQAFTSRLGETYGDDGRRLADQLEQAYGGKRTQLRELRAAAQSPTFDREAVQKEADEAIEALTKAHDMLSAFLHRRRNESAP